MNNLSGKKALVILTNEAYLPKSQQAQNNPKVEMITNPNGCSLQEPATFWTCPNATIQEPPKSYAQIRDSEGDFNKEHQATGVNIFELGYLWLHLRKEHQMDVVFATPRGGAIAMDPKSVECMEKDSNLRDRLREEKDFIKKIGHTLPLNWINPKDFKLVILVGSHGAMFDLPEHEDVACAITEIYCNRGVVAAIGHGIAGLINVRNEKKEQAEYLIKGKRITCPSSDEERQMGVEKYLPYNLEDKLKQRGAKIENKKAFEPNVIVEERLITAQNPHSVQDFVKKIHECASRA